MKYPLNDPCLCGSGLKYKKCCRQYHAGKNPPTPETLARARFMAYATYNVDYIIATTHPQSPQRESKETEWRAQIESTMFTHEFMGMKVILAEGERVHFHYFAERIDKKVMLTDYSIFKQEKGIWYYYDSEKISKAELARAKAELFAKDGLEVDET